MNLYDSASLLVTPNGYKTSKLYSVIPSDGSGDMTFSRAGDTATRVNSGGLIETVLANKPRLDYTSSTCPKLLLEPQRTNLALRSNEFDNASWSKINGASITANTVVSPDGTQNADTLNFNGTAFGQIQQALVKTIGETYTFSLYIKSNSATSVDLYIGGSFSTVTVTSNWTRVSVTKTLSTTDASVKIVSSAIKSFDIYGAQMELGAYPTSYIPTTSATVTRNADSCGKTGISSLLDGSTGTIYFHGRALYNALSTRIICQISDGSDANYIQLNFHSVSQQLRFTTKKNSGTALDLFATIANTTETFKVVAKYDTSNLKLFVNGVLVGTTANSNPNIIGLSSLNLKTWWDGFLAQEELKTLAYWKTALSDADCVTLTTL